jgi:hypothetical protein
MFDPQQALMLPDNVVTQVAFPNFVFVEYNWYAEIWVYRPW